MLELELATQFKRDLKKITEQGKSRRLLDMESWNHRFKVEAIHGEKFKTRVEAKNHIFEYIEIYYNRKRLHSMLGHQAPAVFEVKLAA